MHTAFQLQIPAPRSGAGCGDKLGPVSDQGHYQPCLPVPLPLLLTNMSVVQYVFTPPTGTSLAKATREEAPHSTHGFNHPLLQNMWRESLTLWTKDDNDGMASTYLLLIFDEMGLVNKSCKPFKIGCHTFYGPVVMCCFRDVYNDNGDDQSFPIDVTQEDFDNVGTLVNQRMGYE